MGLSHWLPYIMWTYPTLLYHVGMSHGHLHTLWCIIHVPSSSPVWLYCVGWWDTYIPCPTSPLYTVPWYTKFIPTCLSYPTIPCRIVGLSNGLPWYTLHIATPVHPIPLYHVRLSHGLSCTLHIATPHPTCLSCPTVPCRMNSHVYHVMYLHVATPGLHTCLFYPTYIHTRTFSCIYL